MVTISFGSDQIRTLQSFSQLGKYVHNTLNLSFDSNQIADFDELDALKGLKIREIELKNNPIKNFPDTKYQRWDSSHGVSYCLVKLPDDSLN